MTGRTITIRELAAWPFDKYPHRPPHHGVPHVVPSAAPGNVGEIPSLAELPVPPSLATLLAQQNHRADLQAEMAGHNWHLGLIDLRHLQAFQRRLVLPIEIPVQNTWPALIALNFAEPRKPVYTATATTITSQDPNLQLSLHPPRLHTGSPFFEVATYRARWFLRDGYHRAYALLRAGITQVPAVILHAQTLHQLNAGKPHFFPEEILFSPRPPLVTDFLDDALNITYTRPPFLTTIRVTVEQGEPS